MLSLPLRLWLQCKIWKPRCRERAEGNLFVGFQEDELQTVEAKGGRNRKARRRKRKEGQRGQQDGLGALETF